MAKYNTLHCASSTNIDINIFTALQALFRKVIKYDYRFNYCEYGYKKVNSDIVAIVKFERPGYVLWTTSVYEIKPSTFDAMRREGTKVIAWFFDDDDDVRFEDYSKWWIPHVDFCITNDKETLKIIKLGKES
jgi:hypothetical protein